MVENGGTTGSGTAPNPVVAGWIDQLGGLVQDCPDDAALVDLLSSLESLKGASAGAQAAATVVFAGSQTAIGAAAKTRPDVVRRSVCGQVALARRDSAHRGGRHVGLALALHSELPCTREALAAGRISEWQATMICRETACLDPELRREADARLAGQLVGLGDAGVARAAAKVVAELDPAAVAERAAKAAKDRKVTIRPAPDTMAYLTALLPAANAVACFAALTAHATLAVGEGDGRGRGQIMADALTERLTGGAITGCDREGRPIRADQPGERDERDAEPNREPAGQAEPRSPEGGGTAEPEPAADGRNAEDPDHTADPAADPGNPADGADDAGKVADAAAGPGSPADGADDAGKVADAAAGPGSPADGADDAGKVADAAAGPGSDHGVVPGGSSPVRRPAGVFDPVAALRAGRSGGDPGAACRCGCPCGRCQGGPGSVRYRFPSLRDLRESLVPGPRSAIRFNINVIMSDRTLWGHSDEPADLVGYGPIPADLARDLVATDLGPDVKTFLRRFYTDPQTHQLAAMDSTARFFSTNMKQFMLVRDRECRTPYCHAPARHSDHADDHARGGPTDVGSNGNCRCEQCNHTKQAPGWRVVSRPDGVIVTTTPTGHSYESPPPTPPGATPPATVQPEPESESESESQPEPQAKSIPKIKPWIMRAERAERPAGPPKSNEARPQPRRCAGSDPCRLDVVDVTRRFPDLAIEYRAA